MEKQKFRFVLVIYGEGFLSKRRIFSNPECRDCMYKGSSYCWGQCPYNVWRRDRDY
jgi:radical SAM protein with 4Fe4S-binding SPASM domain